MLGHVEGDSLQDHTVSSGMRHFETSTVSRSSSRFRGRMYGFRFKDLGFLYSQTNTKPKQGPYEDYYKEGVKRGEIFFL